MQLTPNGLRSYRPGLERYTFPNDNFRKQVEAWKEGVKNGTAARALILTGPSGLGKTTLALALAGALGVQERDISQENCANTSRIDEARDLVDKRFSMMPLTSPYRVFILDELHRLTDGAQEVMLTPLEDDLPKTTIVIGCTSEPTSLKRAFFNRFYEIKFDTYPEEQIVEILLGLPNQQHPPALLAKIARVSQGIPRLAISIAEKNPDSPEVQDILAQEVLTAEKFLKGIFTQKRQILFLLCSQIKEESKRAFFDKMLRYLESLWLQDNELQVSLSSNEREFLKTVRAEYDPYKIAAPYVYEKLLELSYRPIPFLRAWIMQGMPVEIPAPKKG